MAQNAKACRCGRPSVEECFKSDAVIFAGKAVDAGRTTTFEVSLVFKGDIGKTVYVYTDFKSSCSYRFTNGREYIVYCDFKKGRLETHYCKRTRYLDEIAMGDIEKLANLTDRPLDDMRSSLPAKIKNMSPAQISAADPELKIKREYEKHIMMVEKIREKEKRELNQKWIITFSIIGSLVIIIGVLVFKKG